MSGYQTNNGDWKPSTAIVRQDSRTSVHTTRATNVTTNTTVTHTATFDSNNQKFVLSRTKETVECQQHAYITVKTSRRTPTPAELAEMMQHVKMQDASERLSKRRSGNFTQSSANRFSGNASPMSPTSNAIDTISLRSTPKFKSHRNSGNSFKNFQFTPGSGGGTSASGPKTPTLVKIENSSVTQSDGRKVTTHVEQQRVNAREVFFKQQPATVPEESTTSTLLTTLPNSTSAKPFSKFNTPQYTSMTKSMPLPAITKTTSSLTSSIPSVSMLSKPNLTTSTASSTTDASRKYSMPLTISSLLNTTSTSINPNDALITKPQYSLPTTISAITTNSITYVSPYKKSSETFPKYTNTNINTPLSTRTTTTSSTTTNVPSFPSKTSNTTNNSTGYISLYKSNNQTTSAYTPLSARITTTTPHTTTYVSPYTRSYPKTVPTSDGSDDKVKSLPMELKPLLKSPLRSENSFSKNSKLKPGIVFILNSFKFSDPNLKPRIGTDADVGKLKKVFQKFKMDCKVITDPKKAKIQELGTKLRTGNFKDLACVVVVVLSHGHRHENASAYDDIYNIDDELVFPMMQNKTLVDKHKILFLQLCKGEKIVESAYQTDSALVTPPKKNYAPNELLKCYSTFEGYVSYRKSDGSIFIDVLCELLEKDGMTRDVREIVDNVKNLVKDRSKNEGNTQVPSFTSTFTMPFIFGDYVK